MMLAMMITMVLTGMICIDAKSERAHQIIRRLRHDQVRYPGLDGV